MANVCTEFRPDSSSDTASERPRRLRIEWANALAECEPERNANCGANGGTSQRSLFVASRMPKASSAKRGRTRGTTEFELGEAFGSTVSRTHRLFAMDNDLEVAKSDR